MDLDAVTQIEEVSARAWPPLECQDTDGWVLRAAGGVTGRANSVWPRRHTGTLSLDGKLDAAAQFYADRGLPLLVQVSPTAEPAGLVAELTAREFAITRAARSVQIASLRDVAAAGDAARAEIRGAADDDWYAVVSAVNASFRTTPDVANALLAGVRQPSAYAVVRADGQVASVGRAVLDGNWIGIFNMATLPDYRRRGGGAAVLAALAEWGRAGGAQRAYLQMEADNDAAPILYAKAGFQHCYEYAFWGKSAAV